MCYLFVILHDIGPLQFNETLIWLPWKHSAICYCTTMWCFIHGHVAYFGTENEQCWLDAHFYWFLIWL